MCSAMPCESTTLLIFRILSNNPAAAAGPHAGKGRGARYVEYVPHPDWFSFIKRQYSAVARAGRLILCHYRNLG